MSKWYVQVLVTVHVSFYYWDYVECKWNKDLVLVKLKVSHLFGLKQVWYRDPTAHSVAMQANVLFRDFQCSSFQLSSQHSTTHSSSSGTAATEKGRRVYCDGYPLCQPAFPGTVPWTRCFTTPMQPQQAIQNINYKERNWKLQTYWKLKTW